METPSASVENRAVVTAVLVLVVVDVKEPSEFRATPAKVEEEGAEEAAAVAPSGRLRNRATAASPEG